MPPGDAGLPDGACFPVASLSCFASTASLVPFAKMGPAPSSNLCGSLPQPHKKVSKAALSAHTRRAGVLVVMSNPSFSGPGVDLPTEPTPADLEAASSRELIESRLPRVNQRPCSSGEPPLMLTHQPLWKCSAYIPAWNRDNLRRSSAVVRRCAPPSINRVRQPLYAQVCARMVRKANGKITGGAAISGLRCRVPHGDPHRASPSDASVAWHCSLLKKSQKRKRPERAEPILR